MQRDCREDARIAKGEEMQIKLFGIEMWASRTKYMTPLSLRFWCYRNWMGGIVLGVRLGGYKYECGWYK
jgi:hypothetical protein